MAIEPGERLGADPATRAQAIELVRNDGVADKAVGPVEGDDAAVDRHALAFQQLEHADVGQAACAAAREHEADARALGCVCVGL